MQETAVTMDPPRTFRRVPLLPHQMTSRLTAQRDLYRSDTQPEQSYSERQLYEAALDRLSREIAAVQRVTETEAIKEIEAALAKGPRRGPKPAEEGTTEEGVEEEAA